MIFAAAVIGVRQAMAKDQSRPLPCDDPLWRLLVGEVGVLVRRVGCWRVSAVLGVAFASALLAQIALSSSTPGPVLTPSWRWAIAAAVTTVVLFAWAVIHAVRSAKNPPVERPRTPHPLAGTKSPGDAVER